MIATKENTVGEYPLEQRRQRLDAAMPDDKKSEGLDSEFSTHFALRVCDGVHEPRKDFMDLNACITLFRHRK